MPLSFFEAILARVKNFFKGVEEGPPEEPLEDRIVRAVRQDKLPIR